MHKSVDAEQRDLRDVACAVQHSDERQRLTTRVLHDQIGMDAPELQRTVGQIFTRVLDGKVVEWMERVTDEQYSR